MIFNDMNTFNAYIDKITENECENITLIIRSGYSMKDLIESEYSLEMLEFNVGNDGEFSWLNDWYEGQVYIEVYDYYSESELLHKLMHLQHKEGLEGYVD